MSSVSRVFGYYDVGAIDDARAAIVGIDRFGVSAPAGVLFKHFGFSVEHVVTAVKRVIAP
jgi:transketolase